MIVFSTKKWKKKEEGVYESFCKRDYSNAKKFTKTEWKRKKITKFEKSALVKMKEATLCLFLVECRTVLSTKFKYFVFRSDGWLCELKSQTDQLNNRIGHERQKEMPKKTEIWKGDEA